MSAKQILPVYENWSVKFICCVSIVRYLDLCYFFHLRGAEVNPDISHGDKMVTCAKLTHSSVTLHETFILAKTPPGYLSL